MSEKETPCGNCIHMARQHEVLRESDVHPGSVYGPCLRKGCGCQDFYFTPESLEMVER